MQDGSWCQYKPGATPPQLSGGYSTPAQTYNPVNRITPIQPVYQRQPSDWDKKVGKQKALCGMVNGLFAGGMKATEITAEVMVKLRGILHMIETASGVPATPAVKPAPPIQEEPPIETYEEPGINVEDVPF